MDFIRSLLFFILLWPLCAQAQKIYTYVGRIEADSFLLAWGTTEGEGNTIGRDSVPLGRASIEVSGRRIESERNWAVVDGLLPDTAYSYRVLLKERVVGEGTVRTYPKKAEKLSFFVLGDYGTGKPPQYEIAEAMWREFEKRNGSDNPVRFVLTTGDNIYLGRFLGIFPPRRGSRDHDWGPKFFRPYERLLRHIPFYPTLGNHDRKSEEPDGDISAYLDNFFFPVPKPYPYYTFSFGGLAAFFALDSTTMDSLSKGGPQLEWLENTLAESESPWKIAYFHHPPFNAGPGHAESLESLRDVVELFRKAGIQVVFNGHEHNFQFSTQGETTGNVLYVITGSGGELRSKDIREKMARSHIAGAASQRHFLAVEIEGRTLSISPLALEPVIVKDQDGKQIPTPIISQTRK